MIIILFFYFKQFFCVEPILKTSFNPIVQILSNQDQLTQFIFNFKLTKDLSDQGYIQIDFPPQFNEPFSSSSYCSNQCDFDTNNVKVYFNKILFAQQEYSISLYNIKNPPQKIGISNFTIKAKVGDNLLQENKIFGSLGIWSQIMQLNSANIAFDEGEGQAGNSSLYNFSFKVAQQILGAVQIVIELPKDTFQISQYPSCQTYAINGYQRSEKIYCEYKQQRIYVNGFDFGIEEGSMIGIQLRMSNPKYSMVTDKFSMYVYKKNTNLAYYQKINIPGLLIHPGSISQLLFQPKQSTEILRIGKILWCQLSFKLQNELPIGSKIQIKFPREIKVIDQPSFVLYKPWSYYLQSGLQNKDNNSEISIVKNTVFEEDILTIKEFYQQDTSSSIVINVLLQLPNISGKTSPLQITSYNQDDNIIDQDTENGYLFIQEIPLPQYFVIDIINQVVDSQNFKQIEITIKPSANLKSGFVLKIEFSNDLLLERISKEDCEIYDDQAQQWQKLRNCQTQDNNQILYFDENLNLGIKKKIRINKSFRPPSFNGSLLFDFLIFQDKQMNQIIQGATQLIQFNEQKFLTFATNIFPRYTNQKSILDISFSFQNILDVSPLIKDPSQLTSYIILQFEFADTDFVDFGINIPKGSQQLISCRSIKGLVAHTNNQINCEFYLQTNPYIIISNYKRVQKEEEIQILIPNLTNPNESWKLTVSCAIEKMRVRKILAYEETYINTTLSLPNGMVTDMNDNSEKFYKVSNKNINEYFDIDFLISDSTTIEKDSRVIVELPAYANGFLTQEDYVICSIQNIFFKCYPFQEINWLYIIVDQIIFPVANKTYIYLGNLIWPHYQIQNFPQNKNIFRFINNQGIITKIINYPYFPRPSPGSIKLAKLQIDKREKEGVDCQYTFKFQSNTKIPINSELYIDLPSVYNLWAPDPAVKIYSQDLEQLSRENNLNLTYTNQQIQITNLPEISKNQVFSIVASGIRNPNFSQSLQNWNIKIKQGDNLIAQKDNFESFLLFDKFTSKRVEIESIDIFPKNQNILAQYTFKFYLQTQIKKTSQIYINFPSEYTYFSNQISYQISGAISNIKKVQRVDSKIIFQIDEDSKPGLIILKIDNIKNPLVEQSSPFYLCTKQDSKILDETKDDILQDLKIIFKEQALNLQVLQFDFSPKTETYQSEYLFTIKPNLDINEQEQIVIIFPETFDVLLGDNIYIIPIEGLQGNLKLNIVDRKIYIYNQFYYSTQTNYQISFLLRGIENPNQNQTNDQGYISIGIIKENMQEYKEFQEQAGKIQTYSQASPMDLVSFELSNYYSRLMSKIYVNFRIEETLNQDQYSIHIVLPIQYQMKYEQEILQCTINGQQEDCNYKYDQINIEITQQITGDVQLQIESIKNPEDEILCDHFKVYVMQKDEKKSILQTFHNLHDLRFQFKFPGPQIIINKNEPIYIEKGSYSNFMTLRMTEISALNLKISTNDSRVKVIPDIIEMNIGDIEKHIKISVPSQIVEDTVMFDWSIIGDLEQPIYTPIKRTQLNLTQKQNLPLKAQQIPEIPLGGSSLAIKLSTPFGPELGLNIELILNIENQYVYLNTTEVNFNPGQTENYFEIFVEENAQNEIKQGYVELLLKGPNKDSYILNDTILPFAIGPQDLRRPEILEIKVVEVSKVHAIINFTANEYSQGFYINVLKNSIIPTFNEVKNQNRFDCDTVRCQFGVVHLDSNYQASVQIDNLEAQTEYTFYIFLQDKGGNIVQIPANIDYQTNPKFNASTAKIFFNQNFINFTEKKMILDYLAFLMSLENYKVLESQYDFYEDIYGIEITNQMTSLTFDILAETKSSVYPSTLELSKILNERKQKIKTKFPNFNSNINIYAQQFVQYELNFTTRPTIKDIGDSHVEMIVKLDNYGWVYAVAITKSEDIGQPTSFQISKGYNTYNLKRSSSQIQVDKKFTNLNIIIYELQQDTDYKVYLSTGSAHPGYPDLLNNDRVEQITFRTLKQKQQPSLSLEFTSIFKCFIIGVIVSVLIN